MCHIYIIYLQNIQPNVVAIICCMILWSTEYSVLVVMFFVFYSFDQCFFRMVVVDLGGHLNPLKIDKKFSKTLS